VADVKLCECGAKLLPQEGAGCESRTCPNFYKRKIAHPTEVPTPDFLKDQPLPSTLPRRIQLNRLTVEELALRQAVMMVEAIGAHPHLTSCVIALQQARDHLADYVDEVPVKS